MQKPRLFRHPSSKSWWCDFYVNGRRMRSSTGTSDRRRAELVAETLAKGEDPGYSVREALEARERSLARRFADGEVAENTLRSFRVCRAMLLNPKYGLDPDLSCESLTPEVLADFRHRQADRPQFRGGPILRTDRPWR